MYIQTKCIHSAGGIETITHGVNTPANEYLDTEEENTL